METIAQEAKRILEPIPAKQWMMYNYCNATEDKCCGMGHLNKAISGCAIISSFESKIRSSAIAYLVASEKYGDGTSGFASINDNNSLHYTQKTPKKRVLALLDDMIKAGY